MGSGCLSEMGWPWLTAVVALAATAFLLAWLKLSKTGSGGDMRLLISTFLVVSLGWGGGGMEPWAVV